MPGQVEGTVKDLRSDKMEAIERTMSKAFRERHIGKPAQVLFEEEKTIAGKKYFIGHTPEYIKVAKAADEDYSDTILTVTPVSFLADDILLTD